MSHAQPKPVAPAARTRARTSPLAHPSLNDDGTLVAELDIAFSTHLTLVVPARLEFAGGTPPQDIDLVIARTQCRNSRPLLKALLDAAQSALSRSALAGGVLRRPRALSARVAGQWHALWAWPAGGAEHGLLAV